MRRYEMSIKLVECFLTRQGEVFPGQRILLMRFKNCNCNCYYCDTKIKMRDFIEGEYDLDVLQETIDDNKVGILLSGGEPTFDQNYQQSLDILTSLHFPFAHVETNGTCLLDLYKDIQKRANESEGYVNNIYYFFSPKQATGGIFYNRIKEFIDTIGDKLIIKVLYLSQPRIQGLDNDESKFLDFLSTLNFNQNIYLMPLGTTKGEISNNMPEVIEVADKYRFNVTTRMHIMENFR